MVWDDEEDVLEDRDAGFFSSIGNALSKANDFLRSVTLWVIQSQ